MTKLEKFGLATAIIGLMADMIALITFFGGLWNTTPQDTANSSSGLPILAQIIMGLIVVYGWFMISWVLLRRRLTSAKRKTIIDGQIIFMVTFGVGILITPILISLWFAIVQTDIANTTKGLREDSIVHATQTAQAFQVTVTANPSAQIPIYDQPKTVTELIENKQFGWWIGYVFEGILILIVLFLCISGALYFLMPFVYPDIDLIDKAN